MARSNSSIPKLVVFGAIAVAGVFLFPSVLAFLKRVTGSTASAAGQPQQQKSGGGAGSGSGGGASGGGSNTKGLTDLLAGFLNGSLIANTADIQAQINTLSDHTFGQWWDSIPVPDLVSPTFDFSNYDFAGPGTQGSLLNDVFNSIPVNIPVFTGGGGGGGGDYVGSGDYFGDVGFSSEEGL